MGRKLGAVPLWGELGPHLTCAEVYLPTKWHLDPSSRLTTINMGRKVGAVPLLGDGELSPHLTQRGLGRGLPPHQVAC